MYICKHQYFSRAFIVNCITVMSNVAFHTINHYFIWREAHLFTYTCCNRLSTSVLIPLPMPRDFSSFFTIFTKNYPSMIL